MEIPQDFQLFVKKAENGLESFCTIFEASRSRTRATDAQAFQLFNTLCQQVSVNPQFH
jgi:hypothetical protein